MFATELIIDKLKELSGFKNCVIVTQDGLSIDSQLDSDIDKNFISAITFSIFFRN
jgi:predicted regulator of Ras-like GTPase activity (Roadblock/LC7/MglB family)